MNIKKSCKTANERGWKLSDQKTLSAEARIIAALKEKSPQEVESICKSAKINKSTFYRHHQLLENSGLIKKVNGKYALWNYTESPSLWDRKQQELQKAGGYLIDLMVEKLELGERDPKTGWCKKIYDKKISVQGVIILKGAVELKAVTRLNFSGENVAALLTTGNVEDDDRFKWKNIGYEVTNVEEVIEGYNFSYRIAYLKYRPY